MSGTKERVELREALELMVRELKAYACKHGLGPAKLQYALSQGEAALAAVEREGAQGSATTSAEPPAVPNLHAFFVECWGPQEYWPGLVSEFWADWLGFPS